MTYATQIMNAAIGDADKNSTSRNRRVHGFASSAIGTVFTMPPNKKGQREWWIGRLLITEEALVAALNKAGH